MACVLTSLVDKQPFESVSVASRVSPFLQRWSRNGSILYPWIDSFAYISDTMNHICLDSPPPPPPPPPPKESKGQAGASDTSGGPLHKEEGKKTREMDADHRRRISLELSKMSHPLENQSPHLYNIANGEFAPP